MKQTKEQLEQFYETPDPWGFKTNPDDQFRREQIVNQIKLTLDGYEDDELYILDIGAGEGFVTEAVANIERVDVVFATELSDKARERWPESLRDVSHLQMDELPPFDLVMTCGTLYPEYDTEKIVEQIKYHNPQFILIAGIEDRLIENPFLNSHVVVREQTFKYREFRQKIVVMKKR